MGRTLRVLLAACLIWAGPTVAIAQTAYPARPVQVVLGFSAGSSTDVATRIVAEELSQALGQRFVADNKPGAASKIASDFVARAPKDGYTLFVGTVANVINTAMRPDAVEFTKELTPIALVGTVPNILVVHPSTGVRTGAALIELARSKPDAISYGSAGIGTSPHMSGELFAQLAGVKMVHVPYSGSAQAVTDLLAGRINIMFAPASSALSHVEAGTLIALASTETARTALAPSLPTVAEAGLAGFDTSVWFGLMAPIGTPPEIVERLSGAVGGVMASDKVRALFKAQGIEPLGGGPEQFNRHVVAETTKWSEVARRANLVAR